MAERKFEYLEQYNKADPPAEFKEVLDYWTWCLVQLILQAQENPSMPAEEIVSTARTLALIGFNIGTESVFDIEPPSIPPAEIPLVEATARYRGILLMRTIAEIHQRILLATSAVVNGHWRWLN